MILLALLAATPIVGSAALHEHVMAEHAFSGRWFWGSVDGDEATALRACDGNAGEPTHAGAAALCGVATLFAPDVLGRDTCCHSGRWVGDCSFRAVHGHAAGPAAYREWPIWDTQGHPRYWHGHLERALAAGLKLMVVHAVENEVLCTLADRYATAPQPGAADRHYRCERGDSFVSIARQIAKLKEFVARHPFLQIAYSPADARRIIAAGRMAIVIGIEADYAWGNERVKVDLRKRLDDYHAMGARTIFLAHQINTRLAGAAQYIDALWAQQSLANCFDRDVQCSGPARDYYALSDAVLLARALKPATWDGFRAGGYDVKVEDGIRKNRLGLTPDGKATVAEMMSRGMLIEIGHLSEKAVSDIAEIAAPRRHPLVSSHTFARSTLLPKSRRFGGREGANRAWEFAMSDETLRLIADSGGIAGVQAAPDATATTSSGVANNCVRSTRSLAQTLAHVVDRGVKVAWAGDWMGQGRGVAPRRGYTVDPEDWCADVTADQRAQGPRLPDVPLSSHADANARDEAYFGTRGLAHWGLVGALHRDLAAVELRPDVLAAFRDHGAESFIATWEKSEAAR